MMSYALKFEMMASEKTIAVMMFDFHCEVLGTVTAFVTMPFWLTLATNSFALMLAITVF